MGSRIRDKPEHIFEVFAEVGRPAEPDGIAFVLQSYPEVIQDKKILEVEIPKFAFPAETDSGAVDHFSFVLTDEEGKFKYGFCRHAAGSQTCLCIVSFLPWFEIFYRLLNLLAEILNRTESNHVAPLLEALYRHPLPSPGDKVELLPEDSRQAFSFQCPNTAELPCIPQNRNLTEYYNAVNVQTMMSIYASILQERRILIVSRKLSRLTSCVHGSASLLYPMFWQHIYIPVLPPHLIDYCTAPMPFLIGVHSTLFQKLRLSELGDVVIVDADHSMITSEYNDLEVLPSEVVSLLKKRLKAQNAEKIGSSILGDGVAKAFLRANVALIGGYRQALRFPPGEQITFDEDAFIHSRPSTMQPFLQMILHTQMFEQFINDRLDKLIAGEGFSDIFDEEVNLEHDKWATQSRYREWYSNMKKQGKKVRKEGKEKWVEFSSKMKEKSRKAVKDIRTKFDELRKDEVHKPGITRNRPTTINSPSLKSQRPPRPPPPDHSSIFGYVPQNDNLHRRPSFERTRQYKVINMDELDDTALMPHTRPHSPSGPPSSHTLVPHSPGQSLYRQSRHSRRLPSEDTDILSDITYQRVSLDLLGDHDIQNMLKKSYSLEDLTMPSEDWDEETAEGSDSGTEHDVILYKSLDAFDKETDKDSDKENDRTYENRISSQDTLVTIDDVSSSDKVTDSNQKVVTDNLLLSGVTSTMATHNRKQALVSVPEEDTGVSQTSRSDTISMAGSSATLQSNMRFEDDFNIDLNVAAPPIPPKVPLKRGHTIDTSTISSSNVALSAAVSGSSSPPPDHPVARPRTSISRQPAFYKQQRPPSFRKSAVSSQQAVDAQTIKEARTAFMKSETTKSVMQKRDELDQFDPLVTGQLAVDTPRKDSNKPSDNEENLLKEWNLDFESRLKGSSYQPPPLPPKPVNLQSYRPYSSSPSGLNTVGGYWPQVGSPFQTAVGMQMAPPHHQSVQQLIRHFSPGGGTQPVGQSASQVVMRNKPDLPTNPDRPSSMYMDHSQDPFSDLVVMSTTLASSNQTAVKSALPPNVYTNGGTTLSSTAMCVSGIGHSTPLKTTIQPGPVIEHPHSPLSHSALNKKPQTWETFD